GLRVTPQRDGGIRVEGSIQCPYFPATELNDALRLPTDKIRVAQTPMGGAFGGKEDYPSMLTGYAALAALKSGRPVQIGYERNEDILYTPKRHPVWVRFKIGYKTDGTLTAIDCDYLLDGGAYMTISDVVMYRGILHCALAYACPNVSIRGRVVRTNSMPCGAFRGFGAPQAIWGLESIVDEIAADCGLAPHQYRLKHHIRPGQRTSTGQLLTAENGTTAVLKTALERSGFAKKLKLCSHGKLRKGQDKLYGIGLSFFGHGSAFTGDGEAKFKAKGRLDLVRLEDGKPGVEIRVSSTEMGQGVHTIFTQIAADALSLDPSRIRFPLADTSRVPNSGPTVASRTTMVVGNVVWGAGCDLRRQLEQFASKKYFRDAPARLDHGQLLADGRKPIPFARAAADLLDSAGGPVSGTYQFILPPTTDWNQTTFKGDAYPGYSWSADVVELEIDPATCELDVKKITSILDIGRVINPLTAKGQVEGGLTQALGYSIMERTAIGAKGVFDAARLQTYIIPTALDVPEMDVQFVEYPYTFAPPGGKGLGEMPMDGLAPAVANAIEAATGARLRELPLTPESLYRALHPQA
ncbi:MAG: molybdopterin-dependent oxidoreductase, partial [Kiritimatiellae bacterium]|nr:molybdopterin-dependent oxidoreductase [Kiritimatiellia bacterium]